MKIIILLILAILLITFIVIYYLLFKKTRKVEIPLDENSLYPKLNYLTVVNNSILCWILIIVNKITKMNYTAITNPLTNRIHIVDKIQFSICISSSVLVCHEYIHVIQSKSKNKIRFLVTYILYWIKKKFSYESIPYEIMAYKYENKFRYEYSELQKVIHKETKDLNLFKS